MNPLNVWILLTARSPGVNIMPAGFESLKPSDVAHALQGLDQLRFYTGMACLGGDHSSVQPLIRLYTIHVVDIANTFGWESRRGSQACRSLAALAVYEFLYGDCCVYCRGTGQHQPAPVEAAKDELDRTRRLVLQHCDAREHRARLRRLKKLQLWNAVLRGEFDSESEGKFAQRLQVRLRARTPQARSRAIRRIARHIDRYVQLTEQLVEAVPCEGCRGRGRKKLTATMRSWALQVSRQHWHQMWKSRYEALLHELEGYRSDCLTHLAEHMDRAAA